MDWKDIVGLVARAAPLAGTLLGGPLPLAAKVGRMVADVLGVDAKPDAIAKHLQENPDAFLKLKELETANGVELTRLFLVDVQSARGREVDIAKVSGRVDLLQYALSFLFVGGFFALVGFLCFRPVPDVNVGPVNQLFGALAAGVGSILAYYFGSSSNEKLAKMKNGVEK